MINIIHPIKWPLFHAQNPGVHIFSADNILLEITEFLFAIEVYTIDFFFNLAPIVMETTRNGTRHIAFNWIFFMDEGLFRSFKFVTTFISTSDTCNYVEICNNF